MSDKKKRGMYKKISLETRKMIIQMCEEGGSFVEIGKKIGIHQSTVRIIFKNYIETGRIFERKQQLLERIKKQSIQRTLCSEKQLPNLKNEEKNLINHSFPNSLPENQTFIPQIDSSMQVFFYFPSFC